MSIQDTVDKIRKGDIRVVARFIRKIDDGDEDVCEVLKELHKFSGHAHIIGITGNPGSGKSTIINNLIRFYRTKNKKVGVVAVDPSSPFSGGAILGDRIRMQEHSNDPEVFLRSVATRGNLGGLSASTSSIVRVMEAMGKDIIIIETVGVGQDEVDIIKLAHTTIVVTVPGLGDDIQAIKAGILEIADIFVVNKADKEGVEKTIRDLRLMLELKNRQEGMRTPPIVTTKGITGEGIEILAKEIEEHRSYISSSNIDRYLNARRDYIEFVDLLKSNINRKIEKIIESEIGNRSELISRFENKELNPYNLVENTIKKVFG
ncbi:MAG: methylmalonyl Co-A mutase-associated GTPase MeaB [Deltaproteobacteria bacterium]|nr:methylmalonyl Co-A mutase-associated GTPase MeaB [Deltaproteobacteria bacterium]